MIQFLLSPIGRITTAALAAVLLLGVVYVKGRSDGVAITTAKYMEEKIRWQAEVSTLQGQHKDQVAQVAADYRAKQQKLQVELDKFRKQPPKVVTKVVEVYIPQKVDSTVPNGFIALHNDAAAGQPLKTTLDPKDAESSKKKLSDVGLVMADNYYSCNATIVQLEALQTLVKQFQIKQKELVK